MRKYGLDRLFVFLRFSLPFAFCGWRLLLRRRLPDLLCGPLRLHGGHLGGYQTGRCRCLGPVRGTFLLYGRNGLPGPHHFAAGNAGLR